MRTLTRTALVPFTSQQMFTLVNDIERYPEFLPWCKASEVLSDNYDPAQGGHVRAAITIRRSRIEERFETKNFSESPHRIVVELVHGPFRHLKGTWEFRSLGEIGCKTELTLEYQIVGAVIERVLMGVIRKTANHVVDAFCVRAAEIYE